MSIIYKENPHTHVKYAYESIPRYDPVSKQARPIKRYLGRVDPVTREVIPSSGRRGRIKESEDRINPPEMLSRDYRERYEKAMENNAILTEKLAASEQTVRKLEDTLKKVSELALRYNDNLVKLLS